MINKPSHAPQNVTVDAWYYEYPTYIILVHEIRDRVTDVYIRTDQIKIPWRKLEASYKRCRRK